MQQCKLEHQESNFDGQKETKNAFIMNYVPNPYQFTSSYYIDPIRLYYQNLFMFNSLPNENYLQLPTQIPLKSTKILNNPQQDGKIKINSKKVQCKCQKSNCQKEYCLCFKRGQQCGQKCGCIGCKNKNQMAFQKVERKKKQTKCNCKKSQCNRKYCECFVSGFKCGQICGCLNCHN